jgi:hypothetical protein
VVDTAGDLDLFTFEGTNGENPIVSGTTSGDSDTFAGGSDAAEVTLKTVSPGIDQITFEFGESLLADHVISYVVHRAV